ncbi:MAG TPA: hypothetical protein VF939_21055 [Puia sp.]
MNWEDLKKQQQEGLGAYWKARGERQKDLQQEQQEILQHCSFIGLKGPEIIKRIFRDQKEAWMDFEKEEFYRLLHWHEHEKANFIEKEEKRNRILSLLTFPSDKARDQGRD